MMSETAAPPPPVRSARRKYVYLLLLLGLTLLGGGGWYIRYRARTPSVPEINLEGADPDVARVIKEARQKVVAQPRSGSAWGAFGKVLLAHAYHRDAEQCFLQAEKLEPRNPEWPYHRAVRLSLQEPASAVPLLERSLEHADGVLPEQRAAIRLRLAETLSELGEVEQARGHFEAVLACDPENAQAHFGLGLLLAGTDRWKESVPHLTRLSDDVFARKKACIQLAALHLRLGETEKARACDERVATLPADLPWVDTWIAECNELVTGRQQLMAEMDRLEAAGNMQAAIELLHDRVNRHPDDHGYTHLGLLLARVGDYTAAEQFLRAALRLNEQKVQAHYFLAFVLFTQAEAHWENGDRTFARGKLQSAIASARRAVELKPQHALAWLYLGRSYRLLEQPDKALEALRQAVRCRPEMSELHLWLGETLADKGEKKDAISHLEAAVRLAPPNDSRSRQALDRVKKMGS